jgi:tight adherence protein C
MSPLAVALGIGLAAAGLVVAFAGARRPVIDAAAVLAELDAPDLLGDRYSLRLAQPFLPRMIKPVARRASGLARALLPGNYREGLRRRLAQAGLGERLGPEEFVVLQLISVGVGAGIAFLATTVANTSPGWSVRVVAFVAIWAAGLPEAWLSRMRERRNTSIRRELPDVLDLLVISVEAGLGLEGAIEVVGRHFDSPLSRELSRMLREMELGLPRRAALQSLRKRVELPELSAFVLSLIQADALGSPIGRVLRVQADELRARRRQWARERAAKLPIKILFPMFMFIFPALFIVILGPAVMSIMHNIL